MKGLPNDITDRIKIIEMYIAYYGLSCINFCKINVSISSEIDEIDTCILLTGKLRIDPKVPTTKPWS